MPLIKVNHLKKTFEDITPVRDICAEINKGDVISIIGPSGTGKSTFLRCLNMLETPTEGDIILDGEKITAPKYDLSKVRQRMGMVFQNFNLFPHKMVIENLMMGPIDLLGVKPQEAYDEGMKILELVGLKDKAKNYPDELSGGQQQRVAIARALAMKPEIILFDEPTSSLDPTMISEVLSVIRQLAKQGLTMIIVTHEMRFAREISTRIFYMDEGIIYEEGTPQQIFENPKKEKTKQFIFRTKNWEWEITDNYNDYHAMIGSLENFAARQFLTAKQLNRIKLAVEELVTTDVFLPTYSDGQKPDVDMVVNAAEEGKKVTLKLTTNYMNKNFLPAFKEPENSTNLSIKMLAKILKIIKFEENIYVEFCLKD